MAGFLSWFLFYYFRKELLQEQPESLLQFFILANAFIIGVFWVALYYISGMYRDLYRRSRAKDALLLLAINFLGVVFIFFTLLLDDKGVTTYKEYYQTFSLYYLLQTFFTISARFIVISRIKTLIAQKKLVFNTLLIGSDKRAKEVYEELTSNHEPLGLRFIGCVSVEGKNEIDETKVRNFGSYKNLKKIIRRCYIDTIIIAVEPSEHNKISEILPMLYGSKVRVEITPDIYQLLLGSVKANHLFGVPLIEINQDLIPLWQKMVKRGIDFSFSFIVLLLGFPVFGLIGILTKFSSHGPIFYSQQRVGKSGKIFNIYKFRSMYVDSELGGPALASDTDERITPWGKVMRRFRLDEIPQFYNVLMGEMALVGPRPERIFFIDQIIAIAPEYRHLQKVRPGLTSLGQVKFGYAGSVEEMVKRLKYDIFYIENMSLAMDFRILFYTIIIILQGRGK